MTCECLKNICLSNETHLKHNFANFLPITFLASYFLHSERLVPADYDEILAELWFHGILRRGGPGNPFNALPEVLLQPLFEAEHTRDRRINGFALQVPTPGGSIFRRVFSALSLPAAADRITRRLIGESRMNAGDAYYYEIGAERANDTSGGGGPSRRGSGSGAGATALNIKRKDPPLSWLVVRLASLLDEAEAVGTHDPHWCHVFYTRRARERSERHSRLGGQNTPATETGAALVGSLCVCPETSEMFVVVTDALEVVDADATRFSLEYTSHSWGRIQTVLAAMKRQPAMATRRLLGQAHGHNFLPAAGADPCALCPQAAVCGRTSAFASMEDEAWMRAVFHRQPFALSHIFGLTARHLRPDPDEVDTLYGMRDGRLMRRPYHVIRRFDPEGIVGSG